MPTFFPEATEVPLNSPPLVEVVCQVRFPAILRITNEEPSEFQEMIREQFPELDKVNTMRLHLSSPGNPAAASASSQPHLFYFRREADKATVALTTDFYALSTLAYSNWKDFLSDLKMVDEAIQAIYRPSYATRIGLRYINKLTTENTGTLDRAELIGLMREELTATLRGEVWSKVSEMTTLLSFVKDPVQMNLRYGYEHSEDNDNPSFLLDFDCFEEGKHPFDSLLERCERYHEIIYNAFRWCLPLETLERFV